jgi:hypothetical protein
MLVLHNATPFICLRFIPLPLLLRVITSFIIHYREPIKSEQEAATCCLMVAAEPECCSMWDAIQIVGFM